MYCTWKRVNQGPLESPDSILNQGDYPVTFDKVKPDDCGPMGFFAMEDDLTVANKDSAGDIVEGVSMVRSMYFSNIRKTSDY